MKPDSEMAETLSASADFQKYARAYADASNLPLALRPVETWRLSLHGKSNENPWCALMAEKSRTCAACLEVQKRLTQLAAHEPATISCPFGLSEVAAPIILDAKTIAYLQSGQVLRKAPTQSSFRKAMAEVRRHGVNLDRTAARKAYFAAPVVSANKLAAIGTLLSIFGERLARTAKSASAGPGRGELPAIAKARQYIHEHYSENLSLQQVASAVHLSSFYFCKLFKTTTGKPFTQFVSDVRIEKARNLLLNRELRVSEIAYEVGFQSLTHFNRVFKKRTGLSPRDYRRQLPD